MVCGTRIVQRNQVRFLHIGDYKTGTTWLQNKVFGLDSRIRLIGEDETDQGVELWAALENLTYAENVDVDSWSQDFNKLVFKNESENGVVYGISRESLISDNPFHFHRWRRMADRLHSAFGQTKVIITFREQLSLLNSLYSTFIKNGGTSKIEDLYLNQEQFDACLERLNYHQIALYYRELFGSENCLFLSFNELCEDPDSYINKIYNFVDVPPLILDDSARYSTPNKSLASVALKFQRIMNHGVRSTYSKEGAQPLFEPIIVKLFQLLRKEGGNLHSRRIDHLLPEVKLLAGFERPIETIDYISGIRRLSEAINFGQSAKLPIAVKSAFDEHIKQSNKNLKRDFDLDLY